MKKWKKKTNNIAKQEEKKARNKAKCKPKRPRKKKKNAKNKFTWKDKYRRKENKKSKSTSDIFNEIDAWLERQKQQKIALEREYRVNDWESYDPLGYVNKQIKDHSQVNDTKSEIDETASDGTGIHNKKWRLVMEELQRHFVDCLHSECTIQTARRSQDKRHEIQRKKDDKCPSLPTLFIHSYRQQRAKNQREKSVPTACSAQKAITYLTPLTLPKILINRGKCNYGLINLHIKQSGTGGSRY